MKRLLSLLLITLILFSACSGGNEKDKTVEAEESSESLEESLPEGRMILDREGKEIHLPERAEKIISLSPSVTQVIVDLGAEDRLIAVDPYSLPDIQNQELPTFDIMNPDAEKLANMGADIVFATTMSKSGEEDDPLKLLGDLGITVVYIPVSEEISNIQKDVLFIGEVLDLADQGQTLIDEMNQGIEEIQKVAQRIEDKKMVYFEISPAPSIYTFGSGVYLNEMIELVGAENMFKEEQGWISATPEAIVAGNPDVIITNVDYIAGAAEEIQSRSGFEEIAAVQNGEVYVISNKSSAYSNHRIVQGLEELAKAIYPEEYGA